MTSSAIYSSDKVQSDKIEGTIGYLRKLAGGNHKPSTRQFFEGEAASVPPVSAKHLGNHGEGTKGCLSLRPRNACASHVQPSWSRTTLVGEPRQIQLNEEAGTCLMSGTSACRIKQFTESLFAAKLDQAPDFSLQHLREILGGAFHRGGSMCTEETGFAAQANSQL
ncbi:hypothetical protein GWK47_001682 [Chionoecetes opilio]|uniref:Uncharacterized protein n=1 Tax=Chionoecetes opilio TaxID=41210 RepID=A0A8J4XVM0_CHIOP|nr:hypothetical protein GWK47_001682 [Chionoecetes opilio]